MRFCCLAIALGILTTGFAEELAPPKAKLLQVRKIWDKAPHNAFTDLIRFRDKWVCVFREGQGHVSPDGALRVITSEDGVTWDSAALVTSKELDLRDAKIMVTPQGKLMLLGAGAFPKGSEHKHQSFVWFSDDGTQWSDAIKVGDPDVWLWRVVWYKDTAYGIGYSTTENRFVRLYKSEDGRNWETLVENLGVEGYANESAILFLEDGTCLCVLRRDPDSGMLGASIPPYTQWNWRSLDIRIGGPQILQLPDKTTIVAARLYSPVRTSLCWLEPRSNTLTEFLQLPSGGDTSYPGMVWHDGRLWVSYYSSHEGKTSIYLAEVELTKQ